jgi:hypothetical protein
VEHGRGNIFKVWRLIAECAELQTLVVKLKRIMFYTFYIYMDGAVHYS